MASTVNVKNRVLAELSNAVPNDKVKRKPLATITAPVAISKTENLENVCQKAKVDGKKKASFCEKENEVVEKLAKLKEVKEVKDVKDVKEQKEQKEFKELKDLKGVKDVKESIEVKEEVKEVKDVKDVKEVVEQIVDDAVKEAVKLEEVKKVEELKDEQVVKDLEVEEKTIIDDSESEIIDKENVENEMLSPCSSDASIVEEVTSPSIDDSFEPHEDDWCFSKMLFLRVLEYEEEIQKYLLRLQVKHRADPGYMARHKPEINEKMRTILVDWMTEVVEEYKMNSETLFLAVNFIDRFLSAKNIARAKFQLLGTAALFISSKYEEIYPPDIHEFVYITDNAYEKSEILAMEAKILQVLDFNVSTPTAAYFLRKHLYSIGLELDLPQTVGIMAEYLCYIALLECNPSTSYLPNDIAVSAIILSASLFGIKINLSGETGQVFFPGFTAEQLKAHIVELQSCIDTLHHLRKSVKVENDALFKSGKPQQAIFSKFAQEKYYSVSLLDIGSQEAPKLLL
ncbi:cyclin-A1 [Tetranychus urticae]|uniref:Uncharacterized protein n=1 Tax=Tetranychus urticae TaxID=32264 RepID=T1JVC6_TETUR|nr:cyclin-A1 [Tetranychus urticae]